MSATTSLQTLENNPAEIDLYQPEWTPESLQLAINRENSLRKIIVAYYKSAMQEGHHFYRIGDSQKEKPALSKEGALNLCSLFKARPADPQIMEALDPDGHYTIRAKVDVISLKNEFVLASGDGLCSTKESKYAFRWMWGSEVPAEIDKATLKKKEWSKNGKDYSKYCVPNENLADLYNTVLKMASKRAMVDAVLKLPLVSELFTQDLDELIAENKTAKSETTVSRRADDSGEAQAAPTSGPPNGKDDMRQRVTNLLAKLKERDFTEAELLGNLGYASVETIPEDEISEAVKSLSTTLNAALQG